MSRSRLVSSPPPPGGWESRVGVEGESFGCGLYSCAGSVFCHFPLRVEIAQSIFIFNFFPLILGCSRARMAFLGRSTVGSEELGHFRFGCGDKLHTLAGGVLLVRELCSGLRQKSSPEN